MQLVHSAPMQEYQSCIIFVRTIQGAIVMRFLSLIILSILVFNSTLVSAEDAIDLESFAKKFIEAEDQAWQQGDFTALEAVEDPNIVFHGLGVDNFAAHKQYIINARNSNSGIHQEWEYLTGDGNLFALSYRAEVTAADQTTTVNALMLFRIGNGRITDVWLNMSTVNPGD